MTSTPSKVSQSKLDKEPSEPALPKPPSPKPSIRETGGFENESRMSMSIMGNENNKYYMDMINLRKKLKKEEESRKLFTEQARKKDDELKRVREQMERMLDS